MTPADVAHEEDVVRRVNEAIEDGLWPDDDGQVVRMRCECGRFDCNAFVKIRVEDYERVRQDPRRFIEAPDHDRPGVESVLERTDGYIVVEKTGIAGEVAEGLDPRAED